MTSEGSAVETARSSLSPVPGASSGGLIESTTAHQRSIDYHKRRSFSHSLEYERVVFQYNQNTAARSSPATLGDAQAETMQFAQQFESGNLKRVVKIDASEFDCELRPDNKKGTTMWFNFQLYAVPAPGVYVFNIVNLVKPESLYNEGLQPCVFSRRERTWKPAGGKCCYFGSQLNREVEKSYVLSFELNLFNPDDTTLSPEARAAGLPWHRDDVYCLAHTFPFTYTDLVLYLSSLENQVTNLNLSAAHCPRSVKNHSTGQTIQCASAVSQELHFKSEVLCQTLEGRDVPVLTIYRGMRPSGKYVVMTARVHPGEANSSWVLKGVLDQVISNTHLESFRLLLTHTLVVVPMLNPDGVALGHYRGDSLGVDLNRQWKQPSASLHPTIEATKRLIKRLHQEGIGGASPSNENLTSPSSPALESPASGGGNVVVFFDLHGHTRKKKVFMYGNHHRASHTVRAPRNGGMPTSPSGGGSSRALPHYEKILPTMFSKQMPDLFTVDDCTYTIKGSKDSTARVVMWEEIGVPMSYTVESSFLSSRNTTYTLDDYLGIGKGLVSILSQYLDSSPNDLQKISTEISKSILNTNSGGNGRSANEDGPTPPDLALGSPAALGYTIGGSVATPSPRLSSTPLLGGTSSGAAISPKPLPLPLPRRSQSATTRNHLPGGSTPTSTAHSKVPVFMYDHTPPLDLSQAMPSSARSHEPGSARPGTSNKNSKAATGGSKSLVEKLIQLRRQQTSEEYPRFGKPRHTLSNPVYARPPVQSKPQLRVSLVKPSLPTRCTSNSVAVPRSTAGGGYCISDRSSGGGKPYTTVRKMAPALSVQALQHKYLVQQQQNYEQPNYGQPVEGRPTMKDMTVGGISLSTGSAGQLPARPGSAGAIHRIQRAVQSSQRSQR